MGNKCYLCVDVGTQSIRTALVSQELQVLASHSDPQRIITAPDGNQIEVDISWIWDSIVLGCREILGMTGIAPQSVAGVCVGAIMHSPVPISDKGELLLNQVQIYSDKRCKDYVRSFQNSLAAEKAYRMTGSIPTASWLGFKIRWIKEHQSEIYKRTWKFLTASSYIDFMLTGQICMDTSEASGTYLWDLNSGEWSPWLAEQMGVDIEKLPPIYNADQIIGTVTERAAALTGLAPGTPVVVGGGDMGCAALAVGSLSVGHCVITTGTASGADMFCAEPVWDPAIINLRHVIDGWLAFGSVECCGASMSWLRKNFFEEVGLVDASAAHRRINELAESVPAGSHGLLYLPQLLGERENLGSPDAKGAFIGLSFDTNLAHFCRALMEGVCYAERRILDAFRMQGLAPKSMYSRGGGTNSAVWNQIRSDIYQMPIHILEEADNSGLIGAAMLAGKGVGLIDDIVQTAKNCTRIKETYYPNPEVQEVYDMMQRAYLSAHESLLHTFSVMSEVNRYTH